MTIQEYRQRYPDSTRGMTDEEIQAWLSQNSPQGGATAPDTGLAKPEPAPTPSTEPQQQEVSLPREPLSGDAIENYRKKYPESTRGLSDEEVASWMDRGSIDTLPDRTPHTPPYRVYGPDGTSVLLEDIQKRAAGQTIDYYGDPFSGGMDYSASVEGQKAALYSATGKFVGGVAGLLRHMDQAARLISSADKDEIDAHGLGYQGGFAYAADFWGNMSQNIMIQARELNPDPDWLEDVVTSIPAALPGIFEFVLNYPWAALVGAAEARDEGGNVLWGATKGAAKRIALGWTFHAIHKLPINNINKAMGAGIVMMGEAYAEGERDRSELAKTFTIGVLFEMGLSHQGKAKKTDLKGKTARERTAEAERLLKEKGLESPLSEIEVEQLLTDLEAQEANSSVFVVDPRKSEVTSDDVVYNGSGESAASVEAINRVASERMRGVRYYKVTRGGTVTMYPPTVDAVDLVPGPGEAIWKSGSGKGGRPTLYAEGEGGADIGGKDMAWYVHEEIAKYNKTHNITTTQQKASVGEPKTTKEMNFAEELYLRDEARALYPSERWYIKDGKAYSEAEAQKLGLDDIDSGAMVYDFESREVARKRFEHKRKLTKKEKAFYDTHPTEHAFHRETLSDEYQDPYSNEEATQLIRAAKYPDKYGTAPEGSEQEGLRRTPAERAGKQYWVLDADGLSVRPLFLQPGSKTSAIDASTIRDAGSVWLEGAGEGGDPKLVSVSKRIDPETVPSPYMVKGKLERTATSVFRGDTRKQGSRRDMIPRGELVEGPSEASSELLAQLERDLDSGVFEREASQQFEREAAEAAGEPIPYQHPITGPEPPEVVEWRKKIHREKGEELHRMQRELRRQERATKETLDEEIERIMQENVELDEGEYPGITDFFETSVRESYDVITQEIKAETEGDVDFQKYVDGVTEALPPPVVPSKLLIDPDSSAAQRYEAAQAKAIFDGIRAIVGYTRMTNIGRQVMEMSDADFSRLMQLDPKVKIKHYDRLDYDGLTSLSTEGFYHLLQAVHARIDRAYEGSKRSFEDIKEGADKLVKEHLDEMGLTEPDALEMLLKNHEKLARVEEVLHTQRKILHAFETKLTEIISDAQKTGTPQNKARVLLYADKVRTITQLVQNDISSVARGTTAGRMKVSGKDFYSSAIELLDSIESGLITEGMAMDVLDHYGGAEAFDRFTSEWHKAKALKGRVKLLKARPLGFFDALAEYQALNILSHPRIFMTNNISNTLRAAWEVVETYGEATVAPLVGGSRTFGEATAKAKVLLTNMLGFRKMLSVWNSARVVAEAERANITEGIPETLRDRLKRYEKAYSQAGIDPLRQRDYGDSHAITTENRSSIIQALNKVPTLGAALDILGSAGRIAVFGPMTMSDAAFKMTGAEAEWNSRLYRLGKSKNLEGADLAKFIGEGMQRLGAYAEAKKGGSIDALVQSKDYLRENIVWETDTNGERTGILDRNRTNGPIIEVYEEIYRAGIETARDMTWQKDFEGKITISGQRLFQEVPFLRLIVPFYRTPMNISLFLLEHTPILGAASKRWRNEFNSGPDGRARAVSKMATGLLMYATVGAIVESGSIEITGMHPPDQRKQRIDDGIPEYSIKIGDTWWSYNRLDPFGAMLGIAVDTINAGRLALKGDLPQGTVETLFLILGNSMDRTAYSQLADLKLLASNPNRYGASFLRSKIMTLLPASGLAKWGQETYEQHVTGERRGGSRANPELEELWTFISEIFMQAAGEVYGRWRMTKQYDIFGNPLPAKQNWFGFEGIDARPAKNSPVKMAMYDINMKGHMDRPVIKGIPISDELFAEFKEELKKMDMEGELNKFVMSEAYTSAESAEIKRLLLQAKIHEFHAQAEDIIYQRYKAQFDKELNKKADEKVRSVTKPYVPVPEGTPIQERNIPNAPTPKKKPGKVEKQGFFDDPEQGKIRKLFFGTEDDDDQELPRDGTGLRG